MSKKTLIIIDMQNDFCKPSSLLFVPNNPDIILKIKKEIEVARKARIKIIYTQDWHEENDREFKIWPKHCIAGTKGADMVDELRPTEKDIVIRKSTYSAFYKTDLDEQLKKLDINTLILTGCVSNICVLFTAADAHFRGYKLVIKKDCLEYVDLLLGIVEEVGELRNICKWLSEEEVKKVISENFEEVEDNIGDMLWFIHVICNQYGIDAESALRKVIERNKKRFPKELVKGKHTNVYAGGIDLKYEE